MTEEVWKPIIGYEGLYEVSNLGRIVSLDYNRTKERKLLKDGDSNGYRKVILYKKGKTKNMKCHKLVAVAFISNPNNYQIINHLDSDRTNNCVSNLEWCTTKQNVEHCWANKKHSGIGKTHFRSKQLIDNSTGKIYDTINEAAIYLEISTTYLAGMVKGRISNNTSFTYYKE